MTEVETSPLLEKKISSDSLKDKKNSDVVKEKSRWRVRHHPSNVEGVFMIVCGVFITLCTAGTIFGFQALKTTLKKDHTFEWLCNSTEIASECAAQDRSFKLMFSVASTVINAAAFPVGVFLDFSGPRMTSLVGTLFETSGLLLFAYSSETFDAYTPAFAFIALGGLFMFLAHIDMINIFPKRMGLVNGLLTGAFDSSSMIPLIWSYMYNGGLSIKGIFLVYLSIPVLNLFFGLFFLRETQIQSAQAPVKVDVEVLENSSFSDDEDFKVSEDETSSMAKLGVRARLFRTRTYYDLQGQKALKQICSWEFIFCCFFICISMLRCNMYIQSVDDQLKINFGKEEQLVLTKAFNYILPIGGVLSVPVVGFLLDKGGIVVNFTVLVLLFVLQAVINFIPNASVQYFGFCVFVLSRTQLYSSVSDFTGRMFGFKNFGTIYGLIMSCAAACNALLIPITSWIEGSLNHNYFIPNTMLLGLQILTLALPIFIYFKNKRIERENGQYSTIR